MISSVSDLSESILHAFKQHTKKSLFTVAISGIDGSGKGFITDLVQRELEFTGYKIANINIDPWQNPIPVRLRNEDPAENFYQHVFRWDDFFDQLITPLQLNKSIYLATTLIRTDADIYYPFTYHYEDVDILLIEGISLLQQRFDHFFDYRVWIDCSFETAMKRALHRNVEKLDEEQLRHDYETYYYPAQRLHLAKDYPQQRADIVFIHEQLL